MGRRATSEANRYQVDEWRTRDDVWGNVLRSVSILRESMSRLFSNLVKTRDFVSAGFYRCSISSAEPVLFSRATHYRAKMMANGALLSSWFCSCV